MDQPASNMNTDRMKKQLFHHKGAHLQPEPSEDEVKERKMW